MAFISDAYNPRWSTDGNWILYLSGPPMRADTTLMRVRRNGESLTTVGVLPYSGGPFSLGPLWYSGQQSTKRDRTGVITQGSGDGNLSNRVISSATEDARSRIALEKVAGEVNRSVPSMIDKDTQLVSASGLDGILVYNYKLINYTVAQIDHNRFAIGVKQKVAQAACNRPETRDDFLRKGVTLRYSYYDRNDQHIATVDVTPSNCGF